MRRIKLLFLQVMVGIVALGLWQLFTTVPIFGTVLLPLFELWRTTVCSLKKKKVRLRPS